MLQQLRERAPGRFLLALAGALALVAAWGGSPEPPPARAADPDKLDNSLAWIPADASFYSTMLRNREQFQAFLNSKAWAKLKDMPAARMLWQMVVQQYTQPEGKLAPLRNFYEQPENRELVALLRDAVSEEVFCYGGESLTDFTQLALTTYNAASYTPMMAEIRAKLRGQAGGVNQGQAQLRAALQALAANANLLKTPDLVIGFKVPDPKKARAQLDRLQGVLNGLVAQEVPKLQGRLKRAKVGEADLLTLTLDGSMVPWEDKIPFKDYEEKAGEFDGLVKKLKTLKLAVSLGVRGNYLLLALGSAPETAARLGAGGQRLIDRPEMRPLAKFADRKLTSVSYVSKDFRNRLYTNKKTLDTWGDMAQELTEQAGLAPEKRKQIDKDVAALIQNAKALTAELGAEVSIAFLADRGTETYAYDYGDHPNTDASKPLALLHHVGGNPILAAVGRYKYNPEAYPKFSRTVKMLYGHADDILKDKLPAEQRDRYQQFMEAFLPLFKRLDQVTGTMLVPALADGQVGFVIDAKWSSKQWQQALPETDKPMPLPELAVVLGVSDADLLRKAMDQYLTLANEMIAKFREVVPEADVPEIKVPRPKVTRAEAGTLYSYPLPEQWGVDRQVVPTAGLSDKVAVLTLSHAAAQRLLADRPLKVQGGPLGDTKRPLAGAIVFNWPALVDAASPWVELALEKSEAQEKAGGEQSPVGDIRQQVRTLLEVLKCYRGSTSATYFEGKVLVTHSESVFRDR